MTSIVNICNQALSHLGSSAQVASLDPPDGSVEAGYCARFFPVARRELLALYPWTFARERQQLAPVQENESKVWAYAYALPSNCLRPIKIYPTVTARRLPPLPYQPGTSAAVEELQQEAGSANFQVHRGVIYTNEPEAVLLSVVDTVDSTRWSPTFVTALGYLLASYLAGSIIRGQAGAEAANQWREAAGGAISRGVNIDANSASETHEHTAAWINAR